MRYAILVIALVLMAFLVMEFNGRTAELKRLEVEQVVIEAHKESRAETKAALLGQIAYATSERAAVQWAQENHMVQGGDQPVVPMQAGQSTPTPTPRPTVVPTEVSNLERWLSLFIDPLLEAQAE
jgi:hypothetical protein